MGGSGPLSISEEMCQVFFFSGFCFLDNNAKPLFTHRESEEDLSKQKTASNYYLRILFLSPMRTDMFLKGLSW